MKRAAFSLILLAASSCVFDPQVPGGVRLDCQSSVDCPPFYVCREGAGVCVPAALGEPRCGDGIVDVGEACGQAPRATSPEDVTRCLTGVAAGTDDIVYVADACAGLLLGLHRSP